uniref:Quinolinate synthase, chloroplastic n=1 Tax=Albugo laibachii Nc14 TaxID=890382 RepID=F0WGL0_9STRA|nr:quinolinate synthetase A protein putative [Albugo laibachii Nc14]|eukprot:CCA20374.1 quinolinate synthetase A protein putative [Albugo laibachii Nc14]
MWTRGIRLTARRSYPTIKRTSSSLTASWSQPFPSILISDQNISAQGSFAQAQAKYFKPDEEIATELDTLLHEKNMGIVAHFYMDPELQGILNALTWPHTFIADSLAMGEAASRMAVEGVDSLAVLGVDFMAESVRATLDSHEFSHLPVYRLSSKKIGCSLAESAEKQAYTAFLQKAAQKPSSLHVVYINTSLRSKAFAHHTIPTITCTSSNVVHTILQAFSQIPDLTVWYGPDTYMGENLEKMFEHLAQLSDSKIKQIHPKHSQKTILDLLGRFEYFKQGNCVVHHMFGDKVTQRVREEYHDAFHTAHFEVPGEMFMLAIEAQQHDRGIVGSTSNILNFIKAKTKEAIDRSSSETLRFVLGTEAGMITSIVQSVQTMLKKSRASAKPQVEIIFPVAADAVTKEDEELVPGSAGGEGCSTAGGCATCPYMKMNDIDSLLNVVRHAGMDKNSKVDRLSDHYPQQYSESIDGASLSLVGGYPILHMKSFMKTGHLSESLVKDITLRQAGGGCPELRNR